MNLKLKSRITTKKICSYLNNFLTSSQTNVHNTNKFVNCKCILSHDRLKKLWQQCAHTDHHISQMSKPATPPISYSLELETRRRRRRRGGRRPQQAYRVTIRESGYTTAVWTWTRATAAAPAEAWGREGDKEARIE